MSSNYLHYSYFEEAVSIGDSRLPGDDHPSVLSTAATNCALKHAALQQQYSAQQQIRVRHETDPTPCLHYPM